MGFKIYNASAGSGKTFTLTIEYLKILLKATNDNGYRNILAITFTNAAVKEMKERILSTLIAFTYDTIPDKYSNYYYKIEEDLKQENLHIDIKAKAKKIVKTLIHDYAAFDIMTIDKFTLKIIKTFSKELNIPSQFEIVLETKLLLKEAVDKVISLAGENKILTDLLIDFAKYKADENKSWNIENDIYTISEVILKDEFFDKIIQLQNSEIEDFIESKEKLNNRVESVVQNIQQISSIIFNDFESHQLSKDDFPYGTFYNQIISLKQINLSDTLKEIKDPKAKKGSKNESIINNFIPVWTPYLEEININIPKLAVYRLILKEIIPSSLISSVIKEFKNLLYEKEILSISDFNKLIKEEIKDEPAPFIYERLGDKYHHFFIDEFQDTSVLQWENLIPLIDNSLVSLENNVPGSLMLVGDPKQAIYRFRGGKAEQFIELANKNIQPFSIVQEPQFLDTNYRSYSNIIEFNNQFFNFISNRFKKENYTEIYKNSSQKINSKEGGFVTIKFIENIKNNDFSDFNLEEDDDDLNIIKPNDLLQLQETHNRIQKCIEKGYRYQDITLLVRNKDKSFLLANYLNERGIKILSSESLLIKNSIDVQFIIHFLLFIDNNSNLEAKAKVLYYIGKNTFQLNEIHSFIADCINKDLIEIQEIFKQYNCHFNLLNSRKKSIYDLVEYICYHFLSEKTTTSYIQYFLDIILEIDSKAQSSIADFIEHWNTIGSDKKIPASEGEDAVKLMTIHKSKGLEFPVVIFPFADYQIKSRYAKIWFELEEENITIPQLYLNRTSTLENYSDKSNQIYNDDLEEELLEVVNILYVALTRAEKELHIITSIEYTQKGLSTSERIRNYFIEFVKFKKPDFNFQDYFEFGLDAKHNFLSKENNTLLIENVKEKLEFDSIKIARKNALMWGTEQQNAITFGNIIHQLMSYINTKEDVNSAINKGVLEGIISIDNKELFQNTINQIIFNEDLVDFFKPNRMYYLENTIITQNNNNAIPDRIEIENNKVFLLDYKTGEELPKHKKQVNEYCQLLENMNYEISKKTLVYIGEIIKVIHL